MALWDVVFHENTFEVNKFHIWRIISKVAEYK